MADDDDKQPSPPLPQPVQQSYGYPASVPDPTQPGASYASPSGYPASNQLASGNGPTLSSIAAGPPQALDVRVNPADPGVQVAANVYRALPADASPEQRAAALQDYRNSLDQRDRGLASKSISAGIYDDSGRPLDNYEQFLVQHGINPFTIGGARISGSGGRMEVPSVDQEYAARNEAERNAGEIARKQQAEIALRKHGIAKGDATALLAADRIHDEWSDQAAQAGLVTKTPKAGFDIDSAAGRILQKRMLSKDNSTLSGVANQPVRQQQVVNSPAAVEAQKLAQMSRTNQQAAQDWSDELARKRAFTYQ